MPDPPTRHPTTNPSTHANPPRSTPGPTKPSLRLTLAVVLAAAAALYLVRLTGPPDLADNDQLKPAAYTLDITQNAHWLVQHDFHGAVASKPPLPVWISAAVASAQGEVTRLALTLPSFLGLALLAALAAWLAHRRIHPAAGLFAGLLVLASITGEKLIALVRTDALFAGLTALTATLVFLAWERRGRGTVPVYLAAAAATLTKGPLCLPLALFGLLALFWERRQHRKHMHETSAIQHKTPPPTARLATEHAIGLAAFLLVTAGWALAAYLTRGDAFTDKVFGDELLGKVTNPREGDPLAINILKSPAYFLTYFAPLSVLTIIGLVQTVREPAADPAERRLERFCFCAFLAGLTLFSLTPHQRPDLLAPLLLPASILAGREVHRILTRFGINARLAPAIAAAAAMILASIVNRYAMVAGEDETHAERIIQQAARDWQDTHLADLSTVYVSTPGLFRFYRQHHSTTLTPDEAANAAAEGRVELIAVSPRIAPDLADALRARGLTHTTAHAIETPDPRLDIRFWRIERN